MDFLTTILLFLSSLAITADVFLFVGILNRATSIVALLLAGLITHLLTSRLSSPKLSRAIGDPETSLDPRVKPEDDKKVIAISFIISALAFFKILLSHPITIAVRTPWTALPPEIFVAFGVMLISAIAWTYARGQSPAALVTVPVAYFGYLSLTLLAFPLGYGFDSFLHRAAETSVIANGLIHPLPVLYGGQYALVAALHFLTNIPVDALDRFLVPTLAALVLPFLLRRFTRAPLVALIFLPLSLLTITTPFAFATLLFIATVLICANGKREERLRVALPIAIAAACVHVIAGIPALVVVGLSLLKHPKHLALASFGGAILVPAAMIAKMKLAGATIAFHSLLSSLTPYRILFTTFRPYQDLAYIGGITLTSLFIFFLILGLRQKEKSETLNHLLAAALAFALSGLMLSALTIPDVIGYEQGDYASRLLLLSVLAISPFMLLGLESFLERLSKKSSTLQLAALVAITILGVGHFYLLYPRADRHDTSKGFNVSSADFLAAQMVTSDAGDKPFSILAPQTTSAAFVSRFGFPADDLTYPIPTGGKLYPYFLQMSSDPKPQVMLGAMQLTDRKLIYFILPKFWWQYDFVKQKTASFASGSWDVDDAITVFKFEKK